MDKLTSFAITIVTTLIFITAVEVVAPENSMKKYIKFVMGLILIAVMLTPIISFFTSGELQLRSAIRRYENSYNKEESLEGDAVESATMESFKKNLDRNCKLELSKEFKDLDFEVDIDCTLDKKEMTYNINSINIIVKDNSVKKVDKVEIDVGSNNVNNKNSNEEFKDVQVYVGKLFNISEDKINLYRESNKGGYNGE